MLFLHGVILTILVLSLLGLGLNLLCLKSLARVPEVKGYGKVSILVPARDEERSIGECVGSLLGQDYPDLEVIVLDDGSADRTGGIVMGLAARDARCRLITGTELPPGWTGKNWACHQLSQAASGEWLLFTDADTVHSAGTLSAAMAMAVAQRTDLLSAWPRLLTLSLGERLVIPVLHVIALCWFPLATLRWLQDRPRLLARVPREFLRACAGANGQFVLFRRTSYERIGGHAAVRNHIVEDLALGREIAWRMKEGMRLMNCDAAPLADCRMYRNFREVCEGFTKNAHAAFEGSMLSWVLVGGSQFVAFFLPFLLFLVPGQFRWALAEVGLIYLIRAILTVRMRTSWVGCLLHPLGQLLAMGIGIRSWVKSVGSGVQWKGRTYRPVFTPQEPEPGVGSVAE
jgi:chlorobactene glucosyltransferase